MLTKRLHSHYLRYSIIHLNGDDIEVRIEPLTCGNCLLSCLGNVTQNVILLMTIRTDMFAVEIELDFLISVVHTIGDLSRLLTIMAKYKGLLCVSEVSENCDRLVILI